VTDRPIAIHFHNRFFEDWPEPPEACDTDCRFTTDPEAFADADAVVFHLPTLVSLHGLEKRPGQLWVAWSLESRVMCPSLDDPAFMRRFDLTMAYERSSDVWYPYFGPGTVPSLEAPVSPRTATAPVVYLQANARDRCGRLEYVAELMRRVRVDSFGAVHRNQDEIVAPGHQPRLDLYRRYKFTLAFENSFTTDYVTEKLYEPLAAGSVPVYRGTDDVADLAPSPDCYIDARGFDSASELAQYLNHLHTHDDEYRIYHEWRTRPWSPAFRAHLEQLEQLPLCRLAAIVEARLRRGDEMIG
jgi:hypothetical protein